jgi:hypothetical protein
MVPSRSAHGGLLASTPHPARDVDHEEVAGMATIHPGRYSAEIEGDFVVFLIGMRLNRP